MVLVSTDFVERYICPKYEWTLLRRNSRKFHIESYFPIIMFEIPTCSYLICATWNNNNNKNKNKIRFSLLNILHMTCKLE